jgi:hypothetical protein
MPERGPAKRRTRRRANESPYGESLQEDAIRGIPSEPEQLMAGAVLHHDGQSVVQDSAMQASSRYIGQAQVLVRGMPAQYVGGCLDTRDRVWRVVLVDGRAERERFSGGFGKVDANKRFVSQYEVAMSPVGPSGRA